jgi:hypothetical protein
VAVTNALAYIIEAQITTLKSFVLQASGSLFTYIHCKQNWFNILLLSNSKTHISSEIGRYVSLRYEKCYEYDIFLRAILDI